MSLESKETAEVLHPVQGYTTLMRTYEYLEGQDEQSLASRDPETHKILEEAFHAAQVDTILSIRNTARVNAAGTTYEPEAAVTYTPESPVQQPLKPLEQEIVPDAATFDEE